jgi:hypothetical protein
VEAYAKLAAACVVGALGWLSQGTANAAELVILTGQGAAPGVRELAAGFERVSGHTVTVLQPDAATRERRINDGTADLITGNPAAIEQHVRGYGGGQYGHAIRARRPWPFSAGRRAETRHQ